MLSRDEVKHIALLSRIGLQAAEVERYQKDLSSVLDWFGELSSLDVSATEPIGQSTGRENVARPDQGSGASDDVQQQIRKNFPVTKDGYVKVQSVF